jgi:hypothetical protein
MPRKTFASAALIARIAPESADLLYLRLSATRGNRWVARADEATPFPSLGHAMSLASALPGHLKSFGVRQPHAPANALAA